MQPAPELCALIERYYQASAEGDAEFLARYIDPDQASLVVGTDLEEWWQGGEETIAIWGKAWRTRGGLPVVGSNPSAYKSGEIGWLSDLAYWVLPDGRKLPFRLTAVYRYTGTEWKLIQAHYSLGVPNAQFADSAR